MNDTSEVFAGVESAALKVEEQANEKKPLIFFSLCFFPPSAGQGCPFNKFKFPELQAKLYNQYRRIISSQLHAVQPFVKV